MVVRSMRWWTQRIVALQGRTPDLMPWQVRLAHRNDPRSYLRKYQGPYFRLGRDPLGLLS